MATLPSGVDSSTQIEVTAQPSLTWIINKETNQVSSMEDGIESVRQAVRIMLDVSRYHYQIYTSNFGEELNSLVGKPEDYIESELPRLVKEALSVDDRIISVNNFSFRSNGDELLVTFEVKCVYGTFSEGVKV